MSFTSWAFMLFFGVVFLLYLRLPQRGQNWLLLLAGQVFYACGDWNLLPLLWASVLANYLCGLFLERSGGPKAKKAWLALGLSFNLGLLAWFKYQGFFMEGWSRLLSWLGFAWQAPHLELLMPLGLSYFTFQLMGYLVDVFRGQEKACRHLPSFLLFGCFFPLLMAGPIERAGRLLPQIGNRRLLTPSGVCLGLWFMVQGYFLKLVVADNAALVSAAAFGSRDLSGAWAFLGLAAYTLQIYADFAGLGRLARGLGMLMGFSLMENFRQPYLAASPREFWQRWHISLSSWLRDYLYIPLGGGRRGRVRSAVNVLLTMTLCGLWHGGQAHYLLWGFYHGLLLLAGRHLPWPGRQGHSLGGRLAGMGLTLFLVALGWLFFAARDFNQVLDFLRALLGRWAWSETETKSLQWLLLLATPVAVMDLLAEGGGKWLEQRWGGGGLEVPRPRRMLYAAGTASLLMMLAGLYALGSRGGARFIYAQF